MNAQNFFSAMTAQLALPYNSVCSSAGYANEIIYNPRTHIHAVHNSVTQIHCLPLLPRDALQSAVLAVVEMSVRLSFAVW